MTATTTTTALLCVDHDFFVNVVAPLQSIPYILLCLSTVYKLDVLFFIGVKQLMMSDAEEREQMELYERDVTARGLSATIVSRQVPRVPPPHVEAITPTRPPALHGGEKILTVSGMYRFVRHPM
jgi:hypothetical protein